MPITKNFAVRERVMDRMLRRSKGATAAEMRREVNEELTRMGLPIVTSRNTLYKDLNNLHRVYGAEITSTKRGKAEYFRYKHSTFSIFRMPLNTEEVDTLRKAMGLLERLSVAPGFEWMAECRAWIDAEVFSPAETGPVIAFEQPDGYRGTEYLLPMMEYIKDRQPLWLDYQKFGERTKRYTVHPYFIRQASARWYLYARVEGEEIVKTFCFDRFRGVQEAEGVTYMPVDDGTDFVAMMQRGIGVGYLDRDPQDIVCRVRAREVPYLASCRLHASQKIDKVVDGWAEMTLHTVINDELKRALLAYSEDVQVIAPKDLRDEMAAIHEQQGEWEKDINNY